MVLPHLLFLALKLNELLLTTALFGGGGIGDAARIAGTRRALPAGRIGEAPSKQANEPP